jgi:uncharacterized protein (DUF1501 family)
MNRRQFLGRSGRLLTGSVMMPLLPRLMCSTALAQQSGSSYKAIVCLYLAGGNDGNNTLIPTDQYYAEYAAGRQELTLPRASLQTLSKAASSGRTFGLHPALSNVASLYNSGYASWLANTGPLASPATKQALTQGAPIPLGLFSHPDQTSEWQSGITQSASLSGWAGRLADRLANTFNDSSVPMIVSTAGWSLLGAGNTTSAAAIGNGTNTVQVLNALQLLSPYLSRMSDTDAKNHLLSQIAGMQSGMLTTTSALNHVIQAGANFSTIFPNTSIGNQLEVIAKSINGHSTGGASRQIFICVQPNYDTHTSQLNSQQSNLADLDAAVGAFASAMREVKMFDNILLFTMSDFARAQTPNTTGGTDHGWGNHHLIVGGAVRGGDVFGTFPSLILGGDDDLKDTGLWIPTTSVSQYAATLSTWLGAQTSDISSVFPELINFKSPLPKFV